MASGDMQRVDCAARLAHVIQNMADAERDADASPPIEPAKPVEGRIERQAGDNANRTRIGERRAVAVEIRQDVELRGKIRALLLAQRLNAIRNRPMPFGCGIAAGA